MTGRKPIPITTEATGITNLLEFLAIITCSLFKVQGKLCQQGEISFQRQINQIHGAKDSTDSGQSVGS